MSDDLKISDIVQITQENSERGWQGWKGCLVIVDEIKIWGIKGHIRGLEGQYPIRVNNDCFVKVGRANEINVKGDGP
jgi:hypothetical protein